MKAKLQKKTAQFSDMHLLLDKVCEFKKKKKGKTMYTLNHFLSYNS